MNFPDDLIIEIVARSPRPIERRLSKEFNRRLGPAIAEMRSRRLLDPYLHDDSRILLHRIFTRGDLDALQFWYYQRGGSISHLQNDGLIEIAAKKGHLDSLEWLDEIIDLDYQFIATQAALYNHLPILQWFHNMELNYTELAIAALNWGNFEILDWFELIGVELPDLATQVDFRQFQRWIDRKTR